MINLLLPDQHQELRALERVLASMPNFDSACRALAARVATILDAHTMLLANRAGTWRLVAEAGDPPSPDTVIAALQLAAASGRGPRTVMEITIPDRGPWTCVFLHPAARTPLALVFAGDWTLSQSLFEELGARLAQSLAPLEVEPRKARRRTAGYALARRLARVTERTELFQVVVEAIAQGVGAQKASLAICDETERTLSITATYGYPAVLVRHLRFRPGAGVIGSVFQSGRAMRVEDAGPAAERPRLRYRTRSFVAAPILGAAGVLGVISVTDHREGRSFDRHDLWTVRGLAAVAALALDRVRAVEDARGAARVAALDPLTGLFNRRQFLMRLDEEVERARRQSTPLTALMLDVDNFKQLNDRLGHLSGDAVLRIMGDVLRRSIRIFDVCARYGGDEFAILMPGSTAESGAQIAERIREGVEGARPPGGPWSDELRVTASIGIAAFEGGGGEDLIARADQALYEAKREGKNRVRFAGGADAHGA